MLRFHLTVDDAARLKSEYQFQQKKESKKVFLTPTRGDGKISEDHHQLLFLLSSGIDGMQELRKIECRFEPNPIVLS